MSIFVKRQVTVSTSMVVKPLYAKGVILYVPIDGQGEVVHPKLCKVLEAWEYREGERREALPAMFDRAVVGRMTLALLKHPLAGPMLSFYENVQDMQGPELQNWSMCLHRTPQHDIHDFQLTFQK